MTRKLILRLFSLSLVFILLGAIYLGSNNNIAIAKTVEQNVLVQAVMSYEEVYADSCLSVRGILGESETELLYDHNNQPAYLLTTTSNGYVIIDRLTSTVL